MKSNDQLPVCVWALMGLVLPLAVQAQTLDLPYESVFKTYQTYAPVPLRDWKASNEAVRAAGGWRQYLRESQAPESLPPAAPLPAPSNNPSSKPNPHSGHGK